MRANYWSLAVVATVSACGTGSVHPFYQASQVYVDSTLLGSWQDSAGEGATFARVGTRYHIRYRARDGKTAQFQGTLFRLGDQRLLDVTVDEIPDSIRERAPDEFWSLLAPIHGLLFLDWSAERLAFAMLEPDSVKAYVRAHPRVIEHLVSGDGAAATTIFTAPTADVQRFVRTIARRAHTLGDSTVWRRVARPEAAPH